MPKHKGGAPAIYTQKFLDELAIKFDKYIYETEIPIIAEFSYLNGIDRTLLYDNEEFSALLKKCVAKKESQLERWTLQGKYNPAMAIFSLKQIGWSDKKEITINSDDETKKKLEGIFNDRKSDKKPQK